MGSKRDGPLFRVVRSNGSDEELATAINYKIALAAWHAAVAEYPADVIELRHGARVVERAPAAR